MDSSLDPYIEIIDAGDTSSVTDMHGMFNSCKSLTTVQLFDTSNVTNMNDMFVSCVSLISVPLFNTSKVTNMNYMFCNCVKLTEVPLFDTSSVTNMNDMFKGCTSLINVPLFNTNNGKYLFMNYMFNGCTNVETGALEFYQQALATGKVIDHESTFTDCGCNTETGLAELKQISDLWGGLKIELPPNTLLIEIVDSSEARYWVQSNYGWMGYTYEKVSDTLYKITTDFSDTNMFDEREHEGSKKYLLKVLDGNTSNLINLNYMFYGCEALTEVSLFDTSNVNNMSSMFSGCSSLTTVPLFDTSKVTTMNHMFENCSSLTEIPQFNISKNTNMTAMFNGCTNVESGALAIYRAANATGKVTQYTNAFSNCGRNTETGLAELQQIPKSWGGLAEG